MLFNITILFLCISAIKPKHIANLEQRNDTSKETDNNYLKSCFEIVHSCLSRELNETK